MTKKPAINLADPNNIGLVSPMYKGATRSQYGHYYGPTGNYLFSVQEEVDLAIRLGHNKRAVPESIVADDTVAEETVRGDAEAEVDDEAEADDIDLVAWAKGEETYPFFKVRSAVNKQFGVTVQNAAQARETVLEPPKHDI